MNLNISGEFELFTAKVLETSLKLIDRRIWDLDIISFNSWVKNFNTDEEKYLCACLLDSLIYRTEIHIISSIKVIFNQLLPSLSYFNPLYVKNAYQMLQKKQGYVKIVTLNFDNQIGKSSHILGSILKYRLKIHPDNIIRIEDIDEQLENGAFQIIMIDDFLGSSDQFISNLSLVIDNNSIDKGSIVYCPLIAHESGVENIQIAFSNIIVKPVEVIKSNYCFFQKYFTTNGNNVAEAKKFYKTFLASKGFPDGYFGHKDLSVSVAFHHSVPDNSLLAFRGKENPKWSCLFN